MLVPLTVPRRRAAGSEPADPRRGATGWPAPTRSACPSARELATSADGRTAGQPARSALRRLARGAARAARRAGRFAVDGQHDPPRHSAAGQRGARQARTSSRATDRLVDYAAPQRFSRERRPADRRTARVPARGSTARIGGVLRLNGAGDGLAIARGARRGSRAAARRRRDRRIAASGAAAAAARRTGWRAAAQRHALRLPDPEPQGAEPCPRRRKRQARRAHEGLAYTAGVVLACIALGGAAAGPARRRARKSAGRSSCRSRAWSRRCCCWRWRSPPTCSACSNSPCPVLPAPAARRAHSPPGCSRPSSPRPCTGPFMAAAMGAALLLPVAGGAGAVRRAGAGHRAAVPRYRLRARRCVARLPKPGRWMVRFRRWMALPMGLTALALLWLASRLGGGGFCAALRAALAVAVVRACWRRCGTRPAGRAGSTGRLAVGAIVLAGAGLLLCRAAVSASRRCGAGIAARSARSARPRWRGARRRASRCSPISPPTGA